MLRERLRLNGSYFALADTQVSKSVYTNLVVQKGKTMKHLIRFLREDSGQDMVEYGLLAAFISIVAIAALRAIGPLVNAVFVKIQAALT
jgi:Flp pilus assembly pilin Flp